MNEGQWPMVARTWQQIGPPLRPSEEDVGFFGAALSAWCAGAGPVSPRGLILGVTPELYRLSWPPGSQLKAADRTPEMIEYVWPGPASDVLRTDWRQLNGPPRSFDIVLCDGGLHLLDYPDGQADLCRRLARLVAPDGLVALRLFVPPSEPETPEQVLAALLAGAIPDLNCLKLRLGMALQASPRAGAALKQVWRTLRGEAPDWSGLAAQLGWSTAQLAVIDAYRDASACYHFVSVAEVQRQFCEDTGGAFELLRLDTPSYAMGSQCPTLVFRRTTLDPAEAVHG